MNRCTPAHCVSYMPGVVIAPLACDDAVSPQIHDDRLSSRVQPTVTFPIGDHVNVLHDYKKM